MIISLFVSITTLLHSLPLKQRDIFMKLESTFQKKFQIFSWPKMYAQMGLDLPYQKVTLGSSRPDSKLIFYLADLTYKSA